jgi:hypothetical protein
VTRRAGRRGASGGRSQRRAAAATGGRNDGRRQRRAAGMATPVTSDPRGCEHSVDLIQVQALIVEAHGGAIVASNPADGGANAADGGANAADGGALFCVKRRHAAHRVVALTVTRLAGPTRLGGPCSQGVSQTRLSEPSELSAAIVSQPPSFLSRHRFSAATVSQPPPFLSRQRHRCAITVTVVPWSHLCVCHGPT